MSPGGTVTDQDSKYIMCQKIGKEEIKIGTRHEDCKTNVKGSQT